MSAFVPKESRIWGNLDYISGNLTSLFCAKECRIGIHKWTRGEFVFDFDFGVIDE